ncbi:MAG: ATP phosphoribosyltransferase regulatory subunit [Pseudomonadota bacterium]|nr:ATP phosphoribosyltransferase regulatory subunit [Pseudomonadota bacterium]
MTTADRWLLPDGIDEILPPQAAKLEQLRRELLDLYTSWGYEQVFPPLVEYLESLLTGAGHDLELQTFKLTDQLTGRMMGVRADMTTQVARIDAHTLGRQGVNRLCYAGHVLHAKPETLGASRSLIQIGAELYGHAGIASDIEIIDLMLETLARAGCDELHLDLGHVGIYRALAAEAGLEPDQEWQLFGMFQRKAVPELKAFLERQVPVASVRGMLQALVTMAGDASVLERARQALSGAPTQVQTALADLQRIAAALESRHPRVNLYFDLGELRGYHYHTGTVFSAYVPGMGQAIANGGRYDHIGEVFGRARPATGFSTDLAVLIQRRHSAPVATRIFAPRVEASRAAALQQAIAGLRARGRVVVQALDGDQTPVELGCTQQLVPAGGDWVCEPVTNS